MARFNRRRTLTATEIGDFAYCPKAWYLKRCGEVAQSPELEPGVAFHRRHGARVSRSARWQRAGRRLGAAAVLLLVVIALLWLLSEAGR